MVIVIAIQMQAKQYPCLKFYTLVCTFMPEVSNPLLYTFFLNLIFVYIQKFYWSGFTHREVIHSKVLSTRSRDSPDRKVSIICHPGCMIWRLPGILSFTIFTVSMSHSDINDPNAKNPRYRDLNEKIKLFTFFFVIPDEFTTYEAKFLPNSSLTGNWIGFTASFNLVDYIDQHYKNISNKEKVGVLWSLNGRLWHHPIGMMRGCFRDDVCFKSGLLGERV